MGGEPSGLNRKLEKSLLKKIIDLVYKFELSFRVKNLMPLQKFVLQSQKPHFSYQVSSVLGYSNQLVGTHKYEWIAIPSYTPNHHCKISKNEA